MKLGGLYVNVANLSQLMAKKTFAQTARDWGITNPNITRSNLRYKSPIEKGIYWYWFSLFVRQRDTKLYGVCISCGKPIKLDNCDAGHFIAAAGCGRDLLFDPMNVHAECRRCNAFDPNHVVGFEAGLVERYQTSLPKILKKRYLEYRDSDIPLKDFTGSEYAEKIKFIKKEAMK